MQSMAGPPLRTLYENDMQNQEHNSKRKTGSRIVPSTIERAPIAMAWSPVVREG